MLFKFRFHFFLNLGESAFKKISFPIYRLKIRPCKCSGCFTEILLICAHARGKEGDSKHEVIPHGDSIGAASLALQKAPQSAKATTPPGDTGSRLWPRCAPGEPRGSSATLSLSRRSSGAGWEASTECSKSTTQLPSLLGYWLGWIFVLFFVCFLWEEQRSVGRRDGTPGEKKHRVPAALAVARRHWQGRQTQQGLPASLGIHSSQSRLHGESPPETESTRL